MSQRAPWIVGVAAWVGVAGVATRAQAQCCTGYVPADACESVALTRSRWCIQNGLPTGTSTLPAAFCNYGDKVVTSLEKVFNIAAPEVFEFELDSATGGAHTGTACGRLGAGVAYDAFSGSAYGVKGFWGYLLSLHEAINDWTGMSSPGWPTDWWADHQSAFPNMMDFHIMNTIGVENADQNLIDAAAKQKKRFYPAGDSADPKVVALDNVFGLMPNGDGYAGFSQLFKLQSADGVRWDNLGVRNPDVKRSEYVVAYMSLAARKRVLSTLQGPGENGGGNICNNTPDGTSGDAPYTCSDAHIDAIASAHCAILANGKKSADLTAFRGGNYGSVPSGPCGTDCPSECSCDSAKHCVALWLGDTNTAGSGGVNGASGSGGGGRSGSGGVSASGGASGRPGSGGASGSGGGGRAGSGGVSASGGASGRPGSGGASGRPGSGGASGSGGGGRAGSGGVSALGGASGSPGFGGASGSAAWGGASGGPAFGGSDSHAAGGLAGSSGTGVVQPGTSDAPSGCTCRTANSTHSSRLRDVLSLSLLALVGLGRRRFRRQ